ncbi:MAG: hypothetical protein DRJ42_09040 [Deltaproteobacteria bacterium]|nr:MAG: hypothetical protein DRJ42_09040 [Deltaproteobacteria bacterium]
MLERYLLLTVFFALVSACAPDSVPVDPEEEPKTLADFEFTNYPTLDAPPPIGFCPDIHLASDPDVGNPHTVVNQTNAHYLAYMAGNAYADFVHFAPEMEALGFGNPGEGARLAQCGGDLVNMRLWESRRVSCGRRGCRANINFSPLVDEEVLADWGDCAAEWYLGRFGVGTDAPEGVDGMFEAELIGTAHYGARLEFFSGGEFDVASESFEKGTTQLMWAEHSTLPLVIVAFRGTEFQNGAEDLWADLNIGKDPFYGWGDVHRGFSNALESVMPLLRDKLSEIEGTDVRIWVTGHSLGAALATLFTAQVLHDKEIGAADHNLIGTYTFGSPRVGDEDFRIRFENLAVEHDVSVWRFRNDRDVVTRIPLSFSFDHVGGLAHFEDNTLTLTSMLDTTLARGLVSDLWEHHFMDGYYRQVGNWTAPESSTRYQLNGVDQVYNCIPD